MGSSRRSSFEVAFRRSALRSASPVLEALQPLVRTSTRSVSIRALLTDHLEDSRTTAAAEEEGEGSGEDEAEEEDTERSRISMADPSPTMIAVAAIRRPHITTAIARTRTTRPLTLLPLAAVHAHAAVLARATATETEIGIARALIANARPPAAVALPPLPALALAAARMVEAAAAGDDTVALDPDPAPAPLALARAHEAAVDALRTEKSRGTTRRNDGTLEAEAEAEAAVVEAARRETRPRSQRAAVDRQPLSRKASSAICREQAHRLGGFGEFALSALVSHRSSIVSIPTHCPCASLLHCVCRLVAPQVRAISQSLSPLGLMPRFCRF